MQEPADDLSKRVVAVDCHGNAIQECEELAVRYLADQHGRIAGALRGVCVVGSPC